MDTKRLYVDFHVLQTVPPSCVNRDDTGSPKTAVYGGATRARVSSQAWKHAIRKMFAEEMADMVETGKRTLKATDLVAGELAALAPELDDARLKKDAKKALENAGIKLKDDNNAALLFLSTAQARALGVPVQQWKLLQKGQSVAVEGRTVQPAQVLGAPRKGLSVVFSGDTAPCPYYLQAAHDADLLICDATYALPEQEDQARQWGHSTFGQSASLAAQARAKRLWLTHYSPMITDPEEYAAQAQSIFPAAECGFDGKSITLQYEEAQP